MHKEQTFEEKNMTRHVLLIYLAWKWRCLQWKMKCLHII